MSGPKDVPSMVESVKEVFNFYGPRIWSILYDLCCLLWVVFHLIVMQCIGKMNRDSDFKEWLWGNINFVLLEDILYILELLCFACHSREAVVAWCVHIYVGRSRIKWLIESAVFGFMDTNVVFGITDYLGGNLKGPEFVTYISHPRKLNDIVSHLPNGPICVASTGKTVFRWERRTIELPYGVTCNKAKFFREFSRWLNFDTARKRRLLAGVFTIEDAGIVGNLFGTDFGMVASLSSMPFRAPGAVLLFVIIEEWIKLFQPFTGWFGVLEVIPRMASGCANPLSVLLHVFTSHDMTGSIFLSTVIHFVWNMYFLMPCFTWNWEFKPEYLAAFWAMPIAYYNPTSLCDQAVALQFATELFSIFEHFRVSSKLAGSASLLALCTKTGLAEHDIDVLNRYFVETMENVQEVSLMFPWEGPDHLFSSEGRALNFIFSKIASMQLGINHSELLRYLYTQGDVVGAYTDVRALLTHMKTLADAIRRYSEGGEFFTASPSTIYSELVRDISQALTTVESKDVVYFSLESRYLSFLEKYKSKVPPEMVDSLTRYFSQLQQQLSSAYLIEITEKFERLIWSKFTDNDLEAFDKYIRDCPPKLYRGEVARKIETCKQWITEQKRMSSASFPSFPLILTGPMGTGKTTFITHMLALLAKECKLEPRGQDVFSVGANDNGWESFPLRGAHVILMNDLTSHQDKKSGSYQTRNVADEIRNLVDVAIFRPEFAFEPKGTTCGKGSTVTGDILALTTNQKALLMASDVENLQRRFDRGLTLRVFVRDDKSDRELAYKEFKDWKVEKFLARVQFEVLETTCSGKIITFSEKTTKVVCNYSEVCNLLVETFNAHKVKADQEVAVMRDDPFCPCGKLLGQHVKRNEKNETVFEKCQMMPLSAETMRVNFQATLYFYRWYLLALSILFFKFWELLALLVFVCTFSLILLYFAFSRDRFFGFSKDQIFELANSAILAWSFKSISLMHDAVKRVLMQRARGIAAKRWGMIAATLGLVLIAVGVSTAVMKSNTTKLEKKPGTDTSLMQTASKFTTKLTLPTAVSIDRTPLLRNVQPTFWSNMPRDHSYSVVNLQKMNVPGDDLLELSKKSVWKCEIVFDIMHEGIMHDAVNTGFAVSYSVNSMLLLRHYFFHGSKPIYDPATVYHIYMLIGDKRVKIKSIIDPFSTEIGGTELLHIYTACPLPKPINSFLPKTRFSGEGFGRVFLKNSEKEQRAKYFEQIWNWDMFARGDNIGSTSSYTVNMEAVQGDCGSLLITDVNDSNSCISGLLYRGVLYEGKIVCVSFIPLARDMFPDDSSAPVVLPPGVAVDEIGSVSVNSVSLGHEFRCLAYLGTDKKEPNTNMRSAFRPSAFYEYFKFGGTSGFSMEEDFIPPRKDTYTVVDGIKKGPIHFHLPNEIDCIYPVERLMSMKGYKELVKRIDTLPEVRAGPIDMWEALNGNAPYGTSAVDATKSVGPTVKKLLGLTERKDLFNEDRSEFTPEFEKILLERFEAVCKNDTLEPMLVGGADKDELRTREKIMMNKVRLFFAVDFADQIVEKVLFTSLMRYVLLHPEVFRWTGALNAVSPQWEELYNRLKKSGTKGFDGDFKSFGAAKCLEIAIVVANILYVISKKLTGYTEDQRLAMKRIAVRSVFQMLYYRGDWIFKVRGDCDGTYKTLFINSLTNLVLFCIAFYELIPEGNYHDDTYGSFQGDDNIHTASDEILQKFNAHTVIPIFRDLGYVYTAADKSDEIIPFKSIDDLTYLKRGFDKHPELGIVGRLNRSSIFKSLAYYRKGSAPQIEVMNSCFRAAQMEMVLYGKEQFHAFQKYAQECAKTEKWSSFPTLSYDDQIERYKSFLCFGLS